MFTKPHPSFAARLDALLTSRCLVCIGCESNGFIEPKYNQYLSIYPDLRALL